MKSLTALIASTAVASLGFLAVAPAAHAAQPTQAQAIKAIPTVAVNATTPGALVVAGHRGLPVTVWTKGAKAQTKRPTAANKAVSFTGLLQGRKYDVYVGDAKSVSVFTAKSGQQPASTTTASISATPGQLDNSMALAWNIPLPKGVAASKVTYTITATKPGASAMQLTRTGASQATLTDLDPSGRYAFTVVAKLPDGSTRTAKTAMVDTVAGAHQRKDASAVTPAVIAVEPAKSTTTDSAKSAPAANSGQTSSGANNSPAPAPGPNPTPAPTPKPDPSKTKTIYVCPDGAVEANGGCEIRQDYTFRTVTSTLPYTYHSDVVSSLPYKYTTFPGICGLERVDGSCAQWVEEPRTEKDAPPSGYTDNGSSYVKVDLVKDAPPAGFYDNGSNYEKVIQEKNDTPAGYTDNGTQWVKTVAKVAKEVPA